MKFTYLLERDSEITSFYGERIIDGKKDFHHGIDIQGKKREGFHVMNQVVLDKKLVEKVASSGKWRLTQNEWISYYCYLVKKNVKGLFVKIESLSFKTKYEFRFIHGDECNIKEGSELKSGEFIGRVGNSGCTDGLLTPNNPNDGVHIHLELKVNGKEVDPMKYMDVYKKDGKWYLRSRKLVVEDPVVVNPPVVDPMISVKESEWQKKIQKSLDDDKEIGVLKDIIKDLNLKIGGEDGNGGLNGDVMELQTSRNKAISDAENISNLLKVSYNFKEKWGDQHYKYDEAIAKLVIGDLSSWQILTILLKKLIGGSSEGSEGGNKIS